MTGQGAANDHPGEGKGVLYAGVAYAMEIVPLYWDRLSAVPPFEITVHRVLWCAVSVALITLARGRLWHVLSVVRTPAIILRLALSSVLITANWTLYIWCVATHRLVEASLGYYLTPLVSIGFGVVLLGEDMSRFRLVAVEFAGVAIAAQALALGHVPWVAPALALSFGIYGYVRAHTGRSARRADGGNLSPVSVHAGAVAFWAVTGTGSFPSPISAATRSSSLPSR